MHVITTLRPPGNEIVRRRVVRACTATAVRRRADLRGLTGAAASSKQNESRAAPACRPAWSTAERAVRVVGRSDPCCPTAPSPAPSCGDGHRAWLSAIGLLGRRRGRLRRVVAVVGFFVVAALRRRGRGDGTTVVATGERRASWTLAVLRTSRSWSSSIAETSSESSCCRQLLPTSVASARNTPKPSTRSAAIRTPFVPRVEHVHVGRSG